MEIKKHITMQKVITITTTTNILGKDDGFIETEYPELNKYLDEGYIVSQLIPVTLNTDGVYKYSLTFVLHSTF